MNQSISYRQFAAASRAGGQKMNRKATAVELRYGPTGTIVWCQDKRTPEQNYELALLNLRKASENPFWIFRLTDFVSKKTLDFVSGSVFMSAEINKNVIVHPG